MTKFSPLYGSIALSGLRPKDKAVLLSIISLSDGDSFADDARCTASASAIAKLSGLSLSSARGALRSLESHGILTIESGPRSATRIVNAERVFLLGDATKDDPLFVPEPKMPPCPLCGRDAVDLLGGGAIMDASCRDCRWGVPSLGYSYNHFDAIRAANASAALHLRTHMESIAPRALSESPVFSKILESGLPAPSKYALVALLALAPGEGLRFSTSEDEVRERGGILEKPARTTRSALKALEDAGLIVREGQRSNPSAWIVVKGAPMRLGNAAKGEPLLIPAPICAAPSGVRSRPRVTLDASTLSDWISRLDHAALSIPRVEGDPEILVGLIADEMKTALKEAPPLDEAPRL